MKFNIKTAMEYSSKLKNVIEEVKRSLNVVTALTNRFSDNDNYDVPAAQNGVYSATVTHQKSKVGEATGVALTDEVVNVEVTNDLAKLRPDVRLLLLRDLMKERANIDYQIETIKNSSTITDAFTEKEVTYDLGCQINKMYRDYNQEVLKQLVEMDSTLTAQTNGKVTVMAKTDDNKAIGSAMVTYPIEIKATSNVDSKAVLEEYERINDKCTQNSANLSAIEISKFFDYEPQFNLNPSIRSLIEKYKVD